MLNIQPIHAFSDNFIWLLSTQPHSHAVVVDPGEAHPVLERLSREGLSLSAILITHKHGDHVGGIRQLLEHFPNTPVYGPADEPIPSMTHPLKDGERIHVPGINAEFEIMDVRGHTEGHIAYLRTEDTVPQLFCGDTLFSVGCGRVFSGTFDQLHDALMRINALPDETQVFCAHEYTLDNIGFAKWVEPDNQALLERESECHELLDHDQNTIPVALGKEKASNPFLRIDQESVREAVETHYGQSFSDSRALFRALRTWKDSEYD